MIRKLVNIMQHIDGHLLLGVSEIVGVDVRDVIRFAYGIHIDPAIYQHIAYEIKKQKKTVTPVRRQHDRSLIVITQGTVVDDYSGGLLRGIHEAAEALQFDVFVHWQHERSNLLPYYAPLFELGQHGDGLIFLTQDNLDVMLALCEKHHLRYVIGDCDINDELVQQHPAIGIDNQQAVKVATQHLIELGHTRIGFLTGSLSVMSAQARLAGYKAALHEAGLPVQDELIKNGSWMIENGLLNTQHLLELPERPTAIVASNDLMAVGALLAINKAGLSIPGDVALVGFDDISIASTVSPPLTTLRQPLEQLGCAAVEMLDEMIAHDTHYVPGRFFDAELIVRESTAG